MLRITHLSAGYNGLPVLKEVSLHIRQGDFAAIVGPNGAGKTTLFKTISGTVPALQGTIEFNGQDLLAIKPAARPHLGIAHVPEGRQVFPSLTVIENLEMGAYTEAGQAAWKENREDIFLVSRARRTPRGAGRSVVGRAAADACDRPRHRLGAEIIDV